MPRKASFDRKKAIETVMHKMWRDGYHRSSVKSLSELLGITRSSFYNAFSSREALFKEVLTLYTEYTPLTKLMLAKAGDPILPLFTAALRELCSMRAKDGRHTGCLAMNSIAELCETELNGTSNELSCHLQQQLSLSNERIELLLTWAQQQNEIPEITDLQDLALALTNLFIGLNIMSKAIPQEDKLWAAAKTTLVALGLYSSKQ